MRRPLRWMLAVALLGAASLAVAPADAPKPLRVYVVRHAQAWKNVPPSARPHAMSDDELDALTPAGLARATALGHELAGKGIAAVYTSPARRAQQTAQAIATALGLGPPIVDEALRTLDTGRDAEAGSGMARTKSWKAGRDPRPAGGESLADGNARATAALKAIAAQRPGEAIAVVTHGEIASSLITRGAGQDLLANYFENFPEEGTAHEIEVR